MAQFNSSHRVSHDRVTMTQHAQKQEAKTEAAECNLQVKLVIFLHVKMSSVKKVAAVSVVKEWR